MAKLKDESFQAVSRGLLAHLPEMTGNQVKLYLYCLLRAKNKGTKKGTLCTFGAEIAEDLKWAPQEVYRILKKMGQYLTIKFSGSRHNPMIITINKFKTVPDFYQHNINDGDVDGSVDGNVDSSVDGNPCKPPKNNKLQTPKKEKKVEEGKKEIDPSFLILANHLKKRVLEVKQQKITDKTLQGWARAVRLMIERDGRRLGDIRTIIDECHDMQPNAGGFTWRNNILSMEKLRERWNEGKIWIGMNKEGGANAKPTWDDLKKRRDLERTGEGVSRG